MQFYIVTNSLSSHLRKNDNTTKRKQENNDPDIQLNPTDANFRMMLETDKLATGEVTNWSWMETVAKAFITSLV